MPAKKRPISPARRLLNRQSRSPKGLPDSHQTGREASVGSGRGCAQRSETEGRSGAMPGSSSAFICVHPRPFPREGHTQEYDPSESVSRVLCSALARTATIHLGPPLPAASNGLPESQTRRAASSSLIWPFFGRGLPSQPGHPDCWWALTPPFHLYPSMRGSLFSVALSCRSPGVGVTHRPALRSSDFPPPRGRSPDSLGCLSILAPARSVDDFP